MKKLFIIFALALSSSAFAYNAVLSNTNGVLVTPTNIFAANIVALTNALQAAGYSAGTSGGGSSGGGTNFYSTNSTTVVDARVTNIVSGQIAAAGVLTNAQTGVTLKALQVDRKVYDTNGVQRIDFGDASSPALKLYDYNGISRLSATASADRLYDPSGTLLFAVSAGNVDLPYVYGSDTTFNMNTVPVIRLASDGSMYLNNTNGNNFLSLNSGGVNIGNGFGGTALTLGTNGSVGGKFPATFVTNFAATFGGSATGAVSIVNGVATLQLGSSNAVAVSIATNFQNTFYGDTNALAFANAAGITDIRVRNDLVGFVNELRAAGLWTNLVDATLCQPRFNPTNNLTFMLRTNYQTNNFYSKWGLSLTNGTTTSKITIPDTRTNSQIYFWHIPPNMCDGNVPQRYLGGLANPAADQSLFVCVNGGAVAVRIRNGNSENASVGNNEQPSWLIPWTIFNYNNGFYGRVITSLSKQDQKSVTGYTYDGASLTAFQDFWPAHIDYNNHVPTTNYSLVGLTITAPLTNWIIGVDYKSTNTTGVSKCDLLEGLIFNKVLSYAEYKAVYRAVRWLDPDDEDWIIGGDSTMSLDGQPPVTETNAPMVFIKNFLYTQNPARLNVIDIAKGGDGYNSWCPFSPGGNLNNNAYLTNDFALSSDFAPAAKVKRRVFQFKAGINDFYSQTTTGDGQTTNALWLNALCNSNNIEFQPATCVGTATNGSIYAVIAAREGYRIYCNNWMMTNVTLFGHVIPDHLVANPSVFVTNLNFTVDGTHLTGSNGWIINKKIAALHMQQPVLPDWMPDGLSVGTNQSFTVDNSGNVTATSFTGNGSGLTNISITKFTSPGSVTATNGLISYRTNAWTTAEISTNGFADWNSNSAAMYRSINTNGVIYNKFMFSIP